MKTGYYDRYSEFRSDGLVGKVPFVKISESRTDVYIVFDKNTMRFDNLSYKYYSDPDYAWLILQANPQYGGFEFSIPNGSTLRIPYPLDDALLRYEKGCLVVKKESNLS